MCLAGCGLGLCQLDESIAIWQGKWPEKDRIDRGEHGAVGADPQRQGQHDRSAEARRSAHAAQGQANVPQQRIDEAGRVHVAGAFALYGGVAKLSTSPPPRLICRDPVRAELIFAFADVKCDLAIDVALQTR
jgi:hypothetical protein